MPSGRVSTNPDKGGHQEARIDAMLIVGVIDNALNIIGAIALIEWTFRLARWWYRRRHPKVGG